MPLAREGIREMVLGTVVLGAVGWGLWWLHPALIAVPIVVWCWVISFFRDPRRSGDFSAGEMCAPADGTVTEITKLDHDALVGGPAVRVGIFLSIFNVHANRAPCAGLVRAVTYKPGKFLDARHPDSGAENEANTLVIAPDSPHAGPVVVRQVSGLIARRIICHAREGTRLERGERFGMIKFGSRTELIVPAQGAEVTVRLGDKVKAGSSLILRQVVPENQETSEQSHEGRRTQSAAETA